MYALIGCVFLGCARKDKTETIPAQEQEEVKCCTPSERARGNSRLQDYTQVLQNISYFPDKSIADIESVYFDARKSTFVDQLNRITTFESIAWAETVTLFDNDEPIEIQKQVDPKWWTRFTRYYLVVKVTSAGSIGYLNLNGDYWDRYENEIQHKIFSVDDLRKNPSTLFDWANLTFKEKIQRQDHKYQIDFDLINDYRRCRALSVQANLCPHPKLRPFFENYQFQLDVKASVVPPKTIAPAPWNMFVTPFFNLGSGEFSYLSASFGYFGPVEAYLPVGSNPRSTEEANVNSKSILVTDFPGESFVPYQMLANVLTDSNALCSRTYKELSGGLLTNQLSVGNPYLDSKVIRRISGFLAFSLFDNDAFDLSENELSGLRGSITNAQEQVSLPLRREDLDRVDIGLCERNGIHSISRRGVLR
jgi:hypothetical protein